VAKRYTIHTKSSRFHFMDQAERNAMTALFGVLLILAGVGLMLVCFSH